MSSPGAFLPADPDFESKVRDSFNEQQLMHTLGVRLAILEPGHVVLEMSSDSRWTQQDGFLHAGIVTTLMDTACGYAAFSLMPPASRVLSTEFKVNLLSPASGTIFRAQGSVLKPGRTLTVCRGELFSVNGDQEKLVAAMQASMICLKDKTNQS